jgi:hypothetical protein
VTPPCGRASQPYQARGLRGHAVGGHQLLLLAHGADEAERVRAEADQTNGREHRQAQHGAGGHTYALFPIGPAGPENQKRKRQAGGDLDPNSRDQCGCTGAKARARAGREHERGGER